MRTFNEYDDKMANYAPIALFVYKRADLTRQAVDALRKNKLASSSSLYVFADAAKTAADVEHVNEVRRYISSIDGFADVTVYASEVNQGCAKSIIAGVTRIFEQHETIIVVEDDLIVTPNFLNYMNAALAFYSDKHKIFSIGGWSIALQLPDNYSTDVYYLPRCCSWGWATWKDRWSGIDWNISDYCVFKTDKAARRRFNLGGSDLSRMLDLQMKGKIDSWAIRWCYAQYKAGRLTVYPTMSKAANIGFGQGARHTANDPHYKVSLDDTNKTAFEFGDTIETNRDLLDRFAYCVSISYRIKNRLRKYSRALLRVFEPGNVTQ